MCIPFKRIKKKSVYITSGREKGDGKTQTTDILPVRVSKAERKAWKVKCAKDLDDDRNSSCLY